MGWMDGELEIGLTSGLTGFQRGIRRKTSPTLVHFGRFRSTFGL